MPLWLDALMAIRLWGGRRMFFVSDVQFLPEMFVLLRVNALKLLFRRTTTFGVTDKAVRRAGITWHWKTLRWLVLLAGALIIGIAIRLSVEPATEEAFWLTAGVIAFSTFWLLQLTGAAIAAIEAPKYRADDRYFTSEQALVSAGEMRLAWRCRDLSLGGALLETGGLTSLPGMATIELAGVGPMRARLVSRPGPDLAAYAFESPEQRPALIRKLYCTDGYIPSPERWTLPRALIGFVGNGVRYVAMLALGDGRKRSHA
jgi:hypothetical protein